MAVEPAKDLLNGGLHSSSKAKALALFVRSRIDRMSQAAPGPAIGQVCILDIGSESRGEESMRMNRTKRSNAQAPGLSTEPFANPKAEVSHMSMTKP